MPKRPLVWLALCGILGLAFQLRMTVVQETVIERPIRNDAAEYFLSAFNLVFHHTYSRSPEGLSGSHAQVKPDAYRYPGLPLTIAALMKDPPDPPATVRRVQIVNAVAGTCAVALAFFVAQLALPLWAAFAAALLTALSPHLISFTAYLLTEPISSTLGCVLLAAVAFTASKRDGPLRVGSLVGVGVVAALLTMFRPIYLLVGPIILLSLSLRGKSLLRALAFTALGTAVVMLPWFARNAISVSSAGEPSYLAVTMMDGAYPDYMLDDNPDTFPYPRLHDPAAPEACASVKAATGEIARRFAAAPLKTATWYLFRKAGYLWQWDNIDGAGDVFIYPVKETPFESRAAFAMLHDAMKALHVLLLLLGLAGSVFVWMPAAKKIYEERGLSVLRAASLLLAYTSAILIPFAPCTRYAAPVFPALFIMALVPIALMVTRARVGVWSHGRFRPLSW
jgi:hypothetical protein